MTEWLLVAVLIVLALVISGVFVGRYAATRGFFTRLAASLCDPGTGDVAFYMRAFVVKGKVDGYEMRFSTSGNIKGSAVVHSYLLLRHPVDENFRYYAGSDPALVPSGIRACIERIEQVPGFYALIFTSRKTPLAARLISRPMGLGYAPGVLLCIVEQPSFDADLLRRRFKLLTDLLSSECTNEVQSGREGAVHEGKGERLLQQLGENDNPAGGGGS